MKYRRKLPRTPLQDAASFLDAAHRILKRLQRTTQPAAEEDDFILLARIMSDCARVHVLACEIETTLRSPGDGPPKKPSASP
jgi:hypothetical protein